jgi:hypothetical protein
MNNHYVYIHKTKDGIPFYVGKGKGKRAWSTNRNADWKEFVNRIGDYNVELPYTNLSEQKALDIEKKLIADIGVDKLTNILSEGHITHNPYQYMYDTANELICLANITTEDIIKDRQLKSYINMLGELYKLQDESGN